MMRALIDGKRVCEIVAPGAEFPVARPLKWVDCADAVTPATHIYDGEAVVLRPAPPPPSEAERIALIKHTAREVILARLPEWKQANMTARAVELVRAQLQTTLTEADAAELAAIEAAWAWVKAVRAASGEAEASGVTAAAITWPAP